MNDSNQGKPYPVSELHCDAATGEKRSLVDLIVEAASDPSPEGMVYVNETKANAPYRRVTRSAYNSASFVASELMGKTQGSESHSIEFPLLIELDFDKRVKGYWAQPKPVVVRYNNANGDRITTSYTADVLVELIDGRFAVVEAKPFARAEEQRDIGRYRSVQ